MIVEAIAVEGAEQDERVLVKQLKPVALGDKGYSYDRYAGSGPSLSQRVLVFRAGPSMSWPRGW